MPIHCKYRARIARFAIYTRLKVSDSGDRK
jgi:hypothetical protein